MWTQGSTIQHVPFLEYHRETQMDSGPQRSQVDFESDITYYLLRVTVTTDSIWQSHLCFESFKVTSPYVLDPSYALRKEKNVLTRIGFSCGGHSLLLRGITGYLSSLKFCSPVSFFSWKPLLSLCCSSRKALGLTRRVPLGPSRSRKLFTESWVSTQTHNLIFTLLATW